MSVLRRAWLVGAVLLLAASAPSARSKEREPNLVQKANAWLGTLTASQRARAQLAFEDSERRVWHYVPRARRGIPFRDMNPIQRRAAAALASEALGANGWQKAEDIFRLERILREQAVQANPRVGSSWRDPLQYYVTVFGTPAEGRRWGFRIEGHHLSANVTGLGSTVTHATPFFLGASPDRLVRSDGTTVRPLGREGDLALRLVRALDASQRRTAVLGARPLGDVLYGPSRRPTPTGRGLRGSAMTTAQKGLFEALVRAWLELAPPDVARSDLEALEQTGVSDLRFLWMGSTTPTGERYYRVEGPSMLLEFQDLGRHVHMVRRDPRGDFGTGSRTR